MYTRNIALGLPWPCGYYLYPRPLIVTTAWASSFQTSRLVPRYLSWRDVQCFKHAGLSLQLEKHIAIPIQCRLHLAHNAGSLLLLFLLLQCLYTSTYSETYIGTNSQCLSLTLTDPPNPKSVVQPDSKWDSSFWVTIRQPLSSARTIMHRHHPSQSHLIAKGRGKVKPGLRCN